MTCLPEANPPPKCVVNQTKATASEAGMKELFFNLEALQVSRSEIIVLHIGTKPDLIDLENGLMTKRFEKSYEKSVGILFKYYIKQTFVKLSSPHIFS